MHFRAGLTSVLFSELVDRWPCSPVIPLIFTVSSSPPSLWSGQIILILGLKMPFSIDGYLKELVHCSLLLLCLSVPAFVFSCWNSCFQFVLAARFWLEVRKENRKAGCLMNFYFQSCRNCFAVCLLMLNTPNIKGTSGSLLQNVGDSLPPVFESRLGGWSVSGVKHWAVQHLCGRWRFTKDLHFRIRGQMRAVLFQIGNAASGGDLIFSCPFAIC